MKQAFDEKNENMSFEQKPTKALNLHKTFLSEVFTRPLLYMFRSLAQYCNLLVTDSSMSSLRDDITHEWLSDVTSDYASVFETRSGVLCH